MSDTRRVEFDTKCAAVRLRALADTEGMTTPEQAAFWLEKLAENVHRGARRDTWTTARDRAAEVAGIDRSMAKRIWQRWQTMNDVASSVHLKLMLAYESLCARQEAAAEKNRAEWLELRTQNAPHQEPATAGRVRVSADL